MDDVITQWLCVKGCGAILNSRSAAMHTCRGRDDNDPIHKKLKKDWSPAPLHPLALVEKQANDKELWFQTGQATEVHFQESLRALHFSVELYFTNFPTREEFKEAAKDYPIDELGDSTESAALWGMGWVMGRLGESTKEPKK
jgi:hypothetical protein